MATQRARGQRRRSHGAVGRRILCGARHGRSWRGSCATRHLASEKGWRAWTEIGWPCFVAAAPVRRTIPEAAFGWYYCKHANLISIFISWIRVPLLELCCIKLKLRGHRSSLGALPGRESATLSPLPAPLFSSLEQEGHGLLQSWSPCPWKSASGGWKPARSMFKSSNGTTSHVLARRSGSVFAGFPTLGLSTPLYSAKIFGPCSSLFSLLPALLEASLLTPSVVKVIFVQPR